MNIQEAIVELIGRSGVSRAQLADALGVSRPSITQAIGKGGITANKVSKWAEVMGYKLVLVPSQQVRFLHDSCIVVDPNEEG